jgi:integrase
MARFKKKLQGWGIKLRFGEGRDEWFTLAVDNDADHEPLAKDRHRRLQRMAKLLAAAGRHTEARVILEEAAAERNEKAFRAVEVMVEGFSPAEAREDKKPATFRQVAALYTSGTLHELHPDEVPFKGTLSLEGSQTQLAVFLPLLGDKPIADITREDIDEAKRRIPKGSSGPTRRQYVRELRRILKFAVEPLRLVDHTVSVTVPKRQKGEGQIFSFLYPHEERMLSGCQAIPIEWRFLYAFLFRNGTRVSETVQITWDHIDLVTGDLHLDKAWTKMKVARRWVVENDVLEALKLRRAAIPNATLVFPSPTGKKFTRQAVRQRFLADLVRAGLSRPELFGRVDGVRGLTTHDTRATFVTLCRRVGRSDQYIRDRTGQTAKVLEQYSRLVRHAEELRLGWLDPMAVALGLVPDSLQGIAPARYATALDLPPSLAQTVGPLMDQSARESQNRLLQGTKFRFSSTDTEPFEPLTEPNLAPGEGPTAASGPSGPAEKSILDQSLVQDAGPPTPRPEAADPIEKALAYALEQATQDRRYDVVLAVTRELEQRRLARQASNVTSLDSRRKPKGEGK